MEPRIINKFLIVRELVTSACPFLRLTCTIPHTDLPPLHTSTRLSAKTCNDVSSYAASNAKTGKNALRDAGYQEPGATKLPASVALRGIFATFVP